MMVTTRKHIVHMKRVGMMASCVFMVRISAPQSSKEANQEKECLTLLLLPTKKGSSYRNSLPKK
jgi:hypothetical protein